MLHVAVAVVRAGTKVLIARRPDEKHQGGLLEFPGGKVEPGESVREALVRELLEEVAVAADPTSMKPVIQVRHDYGDRQVLLDVWEVQQFAGRPRGLEGQSVLWMAVEDLQDEDFPVANRAIIRALRLPRVWLITGPGADPNTIASKVERFFSRTLAQMSVRPAQCGLMLRQTDLGPRDYCRLASSTLAICQAHKIPFVLHGDVDLLRHFPGAAGVHLSQRLLGSHRPGSLPAGKWLGVSCHSRQELAWAHDAGADYALLSPVLPTTSHPGQPPLGWEAFGSYVKAGAMPIYALGGVSAADVGQVLSLGGQGIAGISHWWDI